MKNKKVYKNNKNGKDYVVENVAIDCTNERSGLIVVLYYEMGKSNKLFVRELKEFKEKFTFRGELVPKKQRSFELVL